MQNQITIGNTNFLHDKYTLYIHYSHEIMETLELTTTTNFSQYLNLYSKVYPRYMSSVTWDKGGKISEGIFNLAQIFKNPNQITISKGFTILRH